MLAFKRYGVSGAPRFRVAQHAVMLDAAMTGKRTVGYFVRILHFLSCSHEQVNWYLTVTMTTLSVLIRCRGIYGRKFPPQAIPHQYLTHINYAFANINRETGQVMLSDSWADVEVSLAKLSVPGDHMAR